MEVEEVKQHEGIQQYYITKIEALQVYAIKCIYLISCLLQRFFTLLCTSWHPVDSVGWASTKCVGSDIFKPWPDQHSWSLNNWGEIAVSIMTAGNGESSQMAPIYQKHHLITLWLFLIMWDVKNLHAICKEKRRHSWSWGGTYSLRQMWLAWFWYLRKDYCTRPPI